MGLITKTYWRWNPIYNIENFSLGKTYLLDEITEEYEILESSNNKTELQLKDNSQVKVFIENNIIVQKTYSQGGKVEGLTIERNFQRTVETSIEKHLERCDKYFLGEKLILGYLDGILGIVILKI